MLGNLGKLRLHWWKKMHFDGAKLLIDGGTHFYVDGDFDSWVKGC